MRNPPIGTFCSKFFLIEAIGSELEGLQEQEMMLGKQCVAENGFFCSISRKFERFWKKNQCWRPRRTNHTFHLMCHTGWICCKNFISQNQLFCSYSFQEKSVKVLIIALMCRTFPLSSRFWEMKLFSYILRYAVQAACVRWKLYFSENFRHFHHVKNHQQRKVSHTNFTPWRTGRVCSKSDELTITHFVRMKEKVENMQTPINAQSLFALEEWILLCTDFPPYLTGRIIDENFSFKSPPLSPYLILWKIV